MSDWTRREIGALPVYQAANLAGLPGVVHGFTTRHGGVSRPPYQSLNLGVHVRDDPASVEANRQRLWAELGFLPSQVRSAEQVHGNGVAVVQRGGLAVAPGADALVTNRTGLLLMLLFADCVPVYIVDPVEQAIGLVHSGWRGTVSGIVAEAVHAMRENFGSRPELCLAAIGPAISGESYEVGQEVADHFRHLDILQHADALVPRCESSGRHTLDLRSVIYAQLLEAGLPAAGVSVSAENTYSDSQNFFSFRRDGETGRMAGFLALRAL